MYMISGTWLVAALLATPPLLGWGAYNFLPGQSICFCQWKSSMSYTFFMVGVCFGGPCSIMTFCYVRILREVRRSKRRVANGAVTTEVDKKASRLQSTIADQRRQKKRQDDLRLTTSFLVVISVFIVSWLPFCVTMFLSVFSPTPVPRLADFSTLLLGCANSCYNPIIYGLMNSKFRQGFHHLYCNVLLGRCRPKGPRPEGQRSFNATQLPSGGTCLGPTKATVTGAC